MKGCLTEYAANELNEKWDKIISRTNQIYERSGDIRSPFERDYTRIIHSRAYRRLKHKTQVFFSPENDHICTRAEHVVHVESISYTIAKYFGLNTELTKAIAVAHDLGHSPFGHQGEKILSNISEKEIGEKFWHEKNGLNMVDKIELIEDPNGNKQKLNLTYAVRDGIISHCGEIDENNLKPREEYIDLNEYKNPNQYAPYTWEGCVVKIADKISYLGRDIEDAIILGILNEKLDDLYDLLNYDKNGKINNTVIINDLIVDLCENSSLEKGLCFSDKMLRLANAIKKFNYENIYLVEKLVASVDYFEIVLETIYNYLKQSFKDKKRIEKICPVLVSDFDKWFNDYLMCNQEIEINEKEYCRAIIYYISGMTDNYAVDMYNRIIRF